MPKMTLDPILQVMMAPSDEPMPKFADMDPASALAFTRQMVAQMEGDITPVGTAVNRHFAGPEGDIKLRIFTPDGVDKIAPAIIAFHGGGWVVGDLDTHDNTCRILAQRTGAIVISVDYRLAPEHRFPAAPEDAYAALVWTAREAKTLGIDPNRIGVAGDSAGGNLAAAVALMARDRSGPKLRVQILAYPALEYKSTTPSMEEMATGYGLEKADMHWFYDHYVSPETNKSDPRLSPILAKDLTGLAPAVISVAGFDPLHDDGERYAKLLKIAGVAVTYFNRTTLVHGFLSMTSFVPAADDAFHEIAKEARRLLLADEV